MNQNQRILKKLNPNYEEAKNSGDDFARHVLDANYCLSFLSKVNSVVPVVSQQTRENLNYVQSYSKNVTVGPEFYTIRKNLKSFTLVLTLAGQGELIYKNKKYLLNPGDCFFINCEEEHFYHTNSDDGWTLTQVHFGGSKLNYLYGIWDSYHCPVVSVKGHPIFGSALDSLEEHCKVSSIPHILEADTIISYLISVLINACVYQNESNYPQKIKRVCLYIDAHYAEPLSLEGIAKENYMSRYYLSREFKKYTGQTPMNYLCNVRITKAKKFLLSTNMSVTEIAEKVGFEYANYFQSVFKKNEGITPMQFRKQWQI